ncbi:MAG TPA: LuxR C-terminal-related transcriptional regulator [Polyangiaceae bacterium]|nr:LuxR C-terminal-related transcriptional regulator [Polyangiaceae bacterium]
MARSLTSSSREGDATLDLLDALGSSLDIKVVLERAYPLLLELVPADYGALGISSSGRPEDYEWIVSQIPQAFFAAYPEMAPHDFVRTSVTGKLNVVLRDEEMIARPDLEANMMYRRAREVGVPLEQVMAVMLHIDDRWQSGLSLYRERRRPFSERERASLQRITPALANAVRSCHLFGDAAEWGSALNALLATQGASIVLIAASGIEVARTAEAAQLIEAWFAPHERRAGSLPDPLLQALAQATTVALEQGGQAQWSRSRADATLLVSFVPVTGMGRARWMLVLKELTNAVPMPPAWQGRLTPREQEVVSAVARGWDNRLIAAELGCSEATVKKHLQKIFDKLGVQSRTALVARVAEQRRV